MPQQDRPEVFGQHMTAEAATRARDGQALLLGLAAMQPVSTAGATDGAKPEQRLLAIVAQLLEQARWPCPHIVSDI